MEISRKSVLIALFVSSLACPAARAQEHPEHPAAKQPTVMAEQAENGILAVAAGAGNLDTFMAAVKAADLTGKLQGEGPFTVFAPSDEAFAGLPEGTLDDLLKSANRAQLAGILACHVVPGKIMAADLVTMKATNVSGQDLAIEVQDGAVTVDGARVVEADLVADNGVIHVVDSVIMPKQGAEPTSDKPKDHPAH